MKKKKSEKAVEKEVEKDLEEEEEEMFPKVRELIGRKELQELGEKMMAYYEVTNTSSEPVRAMASYHVVPEKIGLYFKKIECFCFKEQTYEPGKTVKLPVVFFVDPDMAKDWQADDVRGITLSYTYFRVAAPQATARLEDASAVN